MNGTVGIATDTPPLVRLSSADENVVGVLGLFHPTQSVTDQISVAALERAESEGQRSRATTIIAPAHAKAGFGFAFAAATRGYEVILTVPDSVSAECRRLLVALGAEVVVTPSDEGVDGAVTRAETLADRIDDAFVPQACLDPSTVHRRTVGPAIRREMDGAPGALVGPPRIADALAGVATHFHKDVRTVVADPAGPVTPTTADTAGGSFDSLVTILPDDALAAARRLATGEGLFAGVSSGAVVEAASRMNTDETVVAILPDAAPPRTGGSTDQLRQ